MESISKFPLVLLLSITAAAPALAQPLLSIEEGTHYRELDDPVPTSNSDPDLIETVSVFWYGSPQCNAFVPTLDDWEAEAAGDVTFLRIPAVWNNVMETHARIFYAAREAGVQNTVHRAAFNAIHEQGDTLRTREQARALFADAGVDGDTFAAAWDSDEVTEAVERARWLTRDYGVEKVPSLIINGRYRVSLNSAVQSRQDLLIVTNLVIRQIRDITRSD